MSGLSKQNVRVNFIFKCGSKIIPTITALQTALVKKRYGARKLMKIQVLEVANEMPQKRTEVHWTVSPTFDIGLKKKT